MDRIILLLSSLALYTSAQASSMPQAAMPQASKVIQKLSEINKTQCEKAPNTSAISVVQEVFPINQAQCTPGSIAAKHSGELRLITYPAQVNIDIQPTKTFTTQVDDNSQSGKIPDALPAILKRYPSASYVSNACMFEPSGAATGYLRVGNQVLNKIDFTEHQGQDFGKENSILMRYRPAKLKTDSTTGVKTIEYTSTEYKWRLVTRDWFGKQLQMTDYMAKHPGELKDESDDFLSSNQINFAMQSGPALIRNGDAELLSASRSSDQKPFNMPDSGHKTLSGIDAKGNFVVVDIDGNVGPYCIAQYLKNKYGIQNLLTRDAYRIGGSVYRDDRKENHLFNSSSDTSQVMIVY